MKSIPQIARETNKDRNEIYRVMKLQGIEPTQGKFMTLDEFQEDLIHQYLYFTCKIDELIYESKMNKC